MASANRASCLREKLKDKLSCQICLSEYNKSDRLPKVLDCHHSVCKLCLQELIKKSPRSFPCPVCRKSQYVAMEGAAAFQPNVMAMEILDLIEQEEGLNIRDHEEEGDICENHGGRAFCFVCMTCNIGLCSQCMLPREFNNGVHAEHDIKDVDEAVGVFGKYIDEKVGYLREKRQKQFAVAFEEKIEQVKDEIRAKVSEAHTEIDREEARLMVELRAWKQKHEKSLPPDEHVNKIYNTAKEKIENGDLGVLKLFTEIKELCDSDGAVCLPPEISDVPLQGRKLVFNFSFSDEYVDSDTEEVVDVTPQSSRKKSERILATLRSTAAGDIVTGLINVINQFSKHFIDCKELAMAWNSIFKTLIDDHNCTMFLEKDGLTVALLCAEKCNDNSVLMQIMGICSIIAQKMHLRPHFMNIEMLQFLLNIVMLHDQTLSYLACEVFMFLLSDGADAWTVQAPSRNNVCDITLSTIHKWSNDVEIAIAPGSFKSVLDLLRCFHTPVVQHFAVWMMMYFLHRNLFPCRKLLRQEPSLPDLLQDIVRDARPYQETKEIAQRVYVLCEFKCTIM